MDAVEIFRAKFRTYQEVANESGPETARKALFDGYPERQRTNMGPMIQNNSLYQGFSRAVPIYRQIGMQMEVIDISTDVLDAVLEIQRTCPALQNNLHQEYNLDRPCDLICELDVAATEAAFPEVSGDVLTRMADGHSVCLFKYQRESTKFSQ